MAPFLHLQGHQCCIFLALLLLSHVFSDSLFLSFLHLLLRILVITLGPLGQSRIISHFKILDLITCAKSLLPSKTMYLHFPEIKKLMSLKAFFFFFFVYHTLPLGPRRLINVQNMFTPSQHPQSVSSLQGEVTMAHS